MSFALCSYSHAQQVSLFQNISIKDGLPSNYVFGATEDSNGFLWIGTDKGLAKYDGFRWIVFNTDNGLPGNYIAEIYKAGKNGLWLSISNKGIFYFNTISYQLQFVVSKTLDHLMQTDKDGNLFFYKYRSPGLNVIDGFWVNAIAPQKIETAFNTSATNRFSYLITDFAKRKIYTKPNSQKQATEPPVFNLNKGWQADTMTIDLKKENNLLSFIGENVFCSNQSVYVLNKGVVKKISIIDDIDNNYFNAIRYQNKTIICNEKTGLYFVKDNGDVKQFTEKDGLGSNLACRAYVLRNGKLLLCTLGGGISYKLPEGNATINTSGHSVRGLSQSGSFIYAVKADKLLRFNPALKTAEEFTISDKNIQSVDVWGDKIYISTMTGFSVYAIKNTYLVKENTVIKYAGISNVVKSNGRLFVGSYGNNIMEYKSTTLKDDTTTIAISEKVQPIKNGLAAYNYEDGLQLIGFNGSRRMVEKKDGLPSNAVYHVHEYKDTIWISTKSGIAAYTNGKVVKTISTAQGILGNRCIFSFHDKAGKFWILTDKYLGSYDGNNVTTFYEVNLREAVNDYIHTALYDSAYNTLYTGTLMNLFVNKLEDVDLQSAPQLPSLQKIFIDGKVVADTLLHVAQNYNQLSITFHPFSINPFTKAILLYKLEGRDNRFFELSDSLSISFNKLSSGTYKLKAKIINEDGVESDEKILCTIMIQRPFWQKGWFILLALIATGILSYFITRYFQKIKLKRKEKERLLELQLFNERERISRELHDNLGSSIVTIIAQSDNIEAKLRNQQPEEALQKASELGDRSRETMNILRETIWAVQENSHTFEDFTTRVKTFLQRIYAPTNIEWECIAAGALSHNLSPEQTLHLFRCVQECTQNIIKHSCATKSFYVFEADKSKLNILIKDNGKGFNVNDNCNTNGLKNIQSRIDELNGELTVQSSEEAGTIFKFEIVL